MSTPMRCVCFKQEAAQHTPLEDVKQLFRDVGFKVPCHGLFAAQDRCLAQGVSDMCHREVSVMHALSLLCRDFAHICARSSAAIRKHACVSMHQFSLHPCVA